MRTLQTRTKKKIPGEKMPFSLFFLNKITVHINVNHTNIHHINKLTNI